MKTYQTQLLLLISICFSAVTVSAQGVYLNLSGGYAFGAGKTNNGEFYNATAGQNGITIENQSLSFGQGVTFCINGGYLFNQYIGLELGAGYLMGMEHTFKSNLIFPEETINSYSIRNSSFNLIPSVKFMLSILNDKLSVYSRFGISIPVFNKAFTKNEGELLGTEGFVPTYKESEITPYFKVGYATALGAEFSLNKKISIFAELSSLILSFEYKKETLTKATENGQDVLQNMTVSEKETEYVKVYNLAYNSENQNKPGLALSRSISASSIGLMLGLSLRF